MHILPQGINYDAMRDLSDTAIQYTNDPMVAAMCLSTDFAVGTSDQYLTSILSYHEAAKLEAGQSLMVLSPTGSGKTKVIEQIATASAEHETVFLLTNRIACREQLLHDLCDNYGIKDVPPNLLDRIFLHDNLHVTTYQRFVQHSHRYNKKPMLLILDECHCLTEDSTFSVYPQKMLHFLRSNLDNTKRIYLTATPNDVTTLLWELESFSSRMLTPLDENNLEHALRTNPYRQTRIQRFYLMQANWDYLTFKVYNPSETNVLKTYLEEASKANKKSLVFINDKKKGQVLLEMLPDCQHVYSDEDKRDEISLIASQEHFDSDVLIATKVAENGLSLHDEQLRLIVAETWDPIALQQIIGRARVSRKHPHPIEVLIPDYTMSDFNIITDKIHKQLVEFRKVLDNPDWSMQYRPQPNPYVYYSAISKKPIVNFIGYQTLQKQLDFIQQLIADEALKKHAFVRYILKLYHKEPELLDTMMIDYSNISDCKSRIIDAWNIYKVSMKNETDLKQLKEALKSACNETMAYGKELKSNIQIDTVNDILRFADITERVLPERKVFDIAEA